MITEVFRITSDDSDVLNAPSRLAAIPYAGTLTIEVTANDCDGTNEAELTIQLPDGSVPVDNQLVPASATENALDDRTEQMFTFAAVAGGHFLVAVDISGSTAVIIRATLG